MTDQELREKLQKVYQHPGTTSGIKLSKNHIDYIMELISVATMEAHQKGYNLAKSEQVKNAEAYRAGRKDEAERAIYATSSLFKKRLAEIHGQKSVAELKGQGKV